jgi:hypothetical protein
MGAELAAFVYRTRVTGWAIGENAPDTEHAAAVYDKLEQKILPLHFQDRPRWTGMMKQAISSTASA